MTRWTRSTVATLCGFCVEPRLIRAGDPCLEIQLPGIHRPRYRCVTCAGPAPPDLPPLESAPPIQTTRKMTRVKAFGTVLDFKIAQGGRET